MDQGEEAKDLVKVTSPVNTSQGRVIPFESFWTAKEKTSDAAIGPLTAM